MTIAYIILNVNYDIRLLCHVGVLYQEWVNLANMHCVLSI